MATPSSQDTDPWARVRAIATSTWFLGSVVAVLAWPLRDVVPGVTADPSWQFALHHAAEFGLEFGTEVVFTYGPLGFLKVPMAFYAESAVLSAIYATAVQLALGLTVVWALRRSFSAPIAVLVGLVVASLMAQLFIPTEAILFVVVIWAVVALLGEELPVSDRALGALAGVVCGIEVLAKLNTGLAILAICVTTIVALPAPRRPRLGFFAAAFAITATVLWFATGQSLGSVDDYLLNSYEVIGGYVRGHTVDAPLVTWDEVAAGVMLAGLGVAFVLGTRGLEPLRRAGAGVVLGLFAFAQFKQAFVFHVSLFMPMFVGGMLVPWLAFSWRGSLRYVALAAIGAISILYFPLTQGDLTGSGVRQVLSPVTRAEAAANQLTTLLWPSKREREALEQQQLLFGAYALDPATAAALAGRNVAVHPVEFGLAWANDLQFDPLPVIGTYTTATEELDELNAEALVEPEGPERVLRHRGGIGVAPLELSPSKLGLEFRYAPWEGSKTNLAMLCNFRAAHTTEAYQVLARIPGRCGETEPIGSTVAAYGEPIEIPRATGDRIVLARVHGLEPSGLESVRTLLYRSAFRYVTFDDGFEYRIFPDIDEDLILSVPPRIDLPQPFALGTDSSTMTFDVAPGLGVDDSAELEVEFYSLEVRPVG